MEQNQATAATPFDVSAFEARDTAWIEIQNKQEDGPLLHNGQSVRIEIRSPGTREALSAQHKAELATNARMFAGMRGKPAKETVEGKLTERAEKLAAVTARIENFPIAPLDLYSNPKLAYITAQVEKFHNDWANF